MREQTRLTPEQSRKLRATYRKLIEVTADVAEKDDKRKIRQLMHEASEEVDVLYNKAEGFSSLMHSMEMALIVVDEIGLGRASVVASLLADVIKRASITRERIGEMFGETVVGICDGLLKVNELYERTPVVENENFRKLLFTMAKDVRVILIMIADRVNVMRHIKAYNPEEQKKISSEVGYLYAPLAHRMGLYGLKSEMEDLSMKYTNRETYDYIASKLNETKASRDRYIAEFIAPLRKAIEATGMTFEMKGRTKTISSIYNKMKKHVEFDNIYDLFAIRIIIDCPLKEEKAACWRAYSIVTDMYKPNPARLKDWISVPKSNGYESLHITVFGPEDRWVEVQIRTKRMDEVAEKGFAAHWKYKGIKTEQNMEKWLAGIREVLENPELTGVDFIEDFKLNLYDKEVFVFTPKGDLRRLAKGATVLDFAFDIHTDVGRQCVGAIVNGRNVTIRYVLQNGDQVSILTSQHQEPKPDWLGYVATSRAKTKLRQALREQTFRQAEIGREMLERRLKNWKAELDDSQLRVLMKVAGYKDINVFLSDVGSEKIPIADVKDFIDKMQRETEEKQKEAARTQSAEEFKQSGSDEVEEGKRNVLVLDKGLTDIEFSLAKCCRPIFGDPVFAFVSATGGVKIHRIGCRNEPEMRRKFGYRVLDARWSGTDGMATPVMLHISGNDDIGIMSNIQQLFVNNAAAKLRNINVDSTEGGFDGTITILVNNVDSLGGILKKLQGVKGVRKVERIGAF